MVAENKTFRETKAEYRKRKIKGRVISVFAIVIGVVVVFALGFAARGNEALLDRLGFPYKNNTENTVTESSSYFTRSIFEIEKVFSSLAIYGFDEEAAIRNITDALSQSTSDPYFRYYSPQQYLNLQNEIANANTTYGIGVLFADHDGKAYAADVFSNSPASRAGILTGDVVSSINGDGKSWTAEEVSRYIASHPNETINISWRRFDSSDKASTYEHNTRLKASPSTQDNVVSKLDQKVGVVSISQINETCAEDVKSAITNLQKQGATSFILDLRNCAGGYASVAHEIANLFIDSGKIYSLHTTLKDEDFYATSSVITDKPLVVLTNSNTVGEAEIIAGALKNSAVAQTVGGTTAGHLSVQATVGLSNGGAIRLTAGYYLIGDSTESAEGSGIKPTVSVTNQGNVDSQYNYAKQIANNLSF